jgi:MFS family permease
LLQSETALKSRQIGHAIALAAVLVQAPRLVLTLLAADRQPVETSWQRLLLVVAGIGTAVVLTGGNLYLAHTLATASRWRRLLAGVWLAVLLSSGSLVVPLIAGGLGGRPLYEILGSARLQWAWAVLAALAHELTAAGCMLAAASASALPESAAAGLSQQPAAASAGAVAASAEPLASSAAQPRPCRRGCGKTFASPASELGHLRHCPARPAYIHSRSTSELT